MRKLLLVLVIPALALVGCEKESGSGGGADDEGSAVAESGQAKGKETAAAGDQRFAGFDPAAEQKALQGTWKVLDSAFAKEPAIWKIEGTAVTISRGDETKQGELEIGYPGELAFVEEAGGGKQRSYFAYARSGDEVYIGLGTAGIKRGDTYMLADGGVVVFDGEKCQFHRKKMFDGWEDPVAVTCKLAAEGEEQVLHYEVPHRFKKGEKKAKKVDVIGDLLLNEQMQGHKAERSK